MNKNANCFPHAFQVVEKLWASFDPVSSLAGSDNVGFHVKVIIDCSADGSVAEMAGFV